MSVAKAAFTEELAVCHSDGAMKKRMALTARASVNGEGGSAAVGVSNGISNRHEAKVFDVVAGKQTECGGIGKACDGVEEIRDQRSEERRVGKECGARWGPEYEKNKKKMT